MTTAVGDLVVQNTSTTGTGTLTLTTAFGPYLTAALAGFRDGDTVDYSIINSPSQSESGFGVLGSTQTTLTRNALFSTNGNALVSFTAGAVVRITPMQRSFQPLNTTVHAHYGGVI